ncbi:hypothetical protein CEXT_584031 [Caerostris extrusa]|uniref:Uncharacterized protein n=1 Tax=Caerostris extrusa TaxID=172846 RepID=A0AAV4RTR1_CAEEX|nr:hypothetical protein CEXT_584031 [Caerostris extrusa]
MNSDEIKYSTCMVVSLYRKFVCWWTVVDATSRVLKSNFQSIVYYLKAHCRSRANFHRFETMITYPLNVFLNSTQLIKDNLTVLTQEVSNLIELASSNNPVSEDNFFDVYDIICELQEDLKENFMDCQKRFKGFCLIRQTILEHFGE